MERTTLPFYYFVWILSLSMITISCKDDIENEGEAGKLTRMNIEDAKLLYISSQNSSSKLYGVKNASTLRSTSDKNDQIYEIEYYDNKGKTIQDKIPHYLYDARDYLMAIFKDPHDLYAYEGYLVRKKDGKAFEIPREYIPIVDGHNDMIFNANTNKRRFRYIPVLQDWDFLNVCFDKYDNLYYSSSKCLSSGECPNILHRISITANNHINFTPISVESESVWGFCIDKEGNALYGRAGGEWMRYVSADGSIGEPIPAIIREKYSDVAVAACNLVWSGTEDIMALYEYMAEYDEELDGYIHFPDRKYFLMKLRDGQFERVKELKLKFVGDNLPSSYNVFYVGGKVMYSYFFEGTAILVDISSMDSYREILCAVEANIVIDDKLYNFDKETFSLTHINIENGATTPVFNLDMSPLNGYVNISIMEVTESGVLFAAHRVSDRINVVAKIDLDNEFTILQSNSGMISVITTLD